MDKRQRANPQFDFDLARHSVAASLRPEHAADFSRLSAALRAGAKSQLLFVEYRSQIYRGQLMQGLDEVLRGAGLRAVVIDLAATAGFVEAEQRMRETATMAEVIHLTGGEKWFDQSRWREFNLRREAVARDIGVRTLLWLNPEQIPDVVNFAPDLWAWRAGVYDFVEQRETSVSVRDAAWAAPIDNRDLGERSRRMAELRTRLADTEAPQQARLMMLDELASLAFDMGELDEALRIRRDEQLPVFEKLGDVRSRAMTLGQMADVYQARGELDEALRIRRDEELPVYEKLGDVRSRAVTQTKLGKGLALKGDFSAARLLWKSAHADFVRMRLPEAEVVQNLLDTADTPLKAK